MKESDRAIGQAFAKEPILFVGSTACQATGGGPHIVYVFIEYVEV